LMFKPFLTIMSFDIARRIKLNEVLFGAKVIQY